MVEIAVILAAGLGSRLKDKTKEKPKGFLEIENQTLIERSIENLRKCGIKKIYIGTGYLSEVYEEFASSHADIECIKSDQYMTTSSMYTLYNMKDKITNDFLLLESDLLYEYNALPYLIEDESSDAILASGATYSNDEVYIQANNSGMLENMSKKRELLTDIYGELVGVSKVSLERLAMMCEAFEKQDDMKIDYEYIMVETSKQKPFLVKKVDDLVWCEIDDDNHLNRAIQLVLPRLREKNEKN